MSEILPKFDLEQKYIKENLIRSYLKSGSVNAILHQFPEIPEPTAHRWLDLYDIVKLTGRKPSHLGSILYFLTSWATAGNVPLETWYHHHTHHTIREFLSKPSLHRIVSYIRSLSTRLSATSLVVYPEGEPKHILAGNDITTPNPAVGKSFGALSLPMTYSQSGENPYLSIKRVLQQEVFTNLVIEKKFPHWLIPDHPKSFMNIIVADVNVSVYHLELPWNLINQLSTDKLADLRFIPIDELKSTNPLDTKIRPGLIEIAHTHLSQLEDRLSPSSSFILSSLNQAIISA